MGARVPPARAAAAGVRARDLVESALRRVSPPALPLLESLNGLAEARLLGVAVELGIADARAERSLTAREFAQRVGADHDALGRTMRFLVSRGFFRLTGDRFANNDTTSLLRRDHPESLRDWVGMVGADWHLGIWAQAGHAVRTGRSATDASFFDYVNRVNPAAGRTFNEAMADVSLLVAKLLARAYDFSTVTRVCDVGGGTGARALVVERVLPAGARPEFARVSDLEMLVLTGSGRERRRDEYGAQFARAGLRQQADVVLANLHHVFELVPVPGA